MIEWMEPDRYQLLTQNDFIRPCSGVCAMFYELYIFKMWEVIIFFLLLTSFVRKYFISLYIFVIRKYPNPNATPVQPTPPSSHNVTMY